MNRKTIFRNESQKLDSAFLEAGLPEKVLLVPLDFAKLTHYACFCNGRGQYLRQAFPVKNNTEGLSYLIDAIERTRKAKGIGQKGHVIIGGEDSASYTRNFMDRLHQSGYLTVRMDAKEVHHQADSVDSSTDKTALRAIAKTMLNRDVRETGGTDAYDKLRELTRQRRRIVHLSTSVKNRIHTHADRLFPGFLSPQSALKPFSKSSLALMGKSFSAASIKRRSLTRLTTQLSRQGLREAAKVAAALKEQANAAIIGNREASQTSAQLLEAELRLYETMQKNLECLDYECAQSLASLPEAMLTSVRGIGITLAACICAETGSVGLTSDCDQLNAYAGIVPKVSQTGGPESEAKVGGKRSRFNRVLKDYLLQAGNHLYLHGPEDLMEDARRRKTEGKAVETAMARRFLRMARALSKQGVVYLPRKLRCEKATSQDRAEYVLEVWPDLLVKWKRLNLHQQAFAPDTPLGKWRTVVQNIYEIELPL